ncbi:glycolate oxidase iron-sulfur subunit [Thermanaeromonas toyohensis ToBE]|uniref:Glycolate oxidase iron-sulfur subunit n=1 Tax=Thermanaeromonas toyohensis ToBE TaxID=698762 RepID=A0A1W1W149_9FIRM|nr:(Fe-S)-binding protein [Thermanaeromonas toyohensis]SMB99362.1 glycolate oxidase iron-sulfur subunit [Thermanaeromonas toyohensis ToBE]
MLNAREMANVPDMADMLEQVKEEIERCSKCGTCRAHCPVFEVKHHEPFVARGLIRLARSYLAGELKASRRLTELFSHCLLCKTCTARCPNGVDTSTIVSVVRNKIAAEKAPDITAIVLKNLLPYPKRLGYLANLARVSRFLGFMRIGSLLPAPFSFVDSLDRFTQLLSTPPGRPLRTSYPSQIIPPFPTSRPRGVVAYFTGCMSGFIFPSLGQRVINLLTSLGYEVHLPEQVCCGAPALAYGYLDLFHRLATQNIFSFKQGNYEAIIVDCASCGAVWKEYARWIRIKEAKELASRVQDISQFIVTKAELVEELKSKLSSHGVGQTKRIVTYHDPCHLKKALGVSKEPRLLLQVVSQLEFREMPGADRCCGAAGSYWLTHPDIAQQLATSKVQAIQASGAEVVVTSCPACLMQISYALRKAGLKVEAKHIIEVIGEY